MIPTTQSAVNASGSLPPPLVVLYPGDTSGTIPLQGGAVAVLIETFAPGQSGAEDETYYYGGVGGGYSKKNRMNLAGITALYQLYTAEVSTEVRQDTAGGTVLCKALAGSNTGGTGDLKYSGGNGGQDTSFNVGGGGAAGPNGNGTQGTTSGPGVSGGGPVGYGVGGSSPNYPGQHGCVRLTWYFE